VAIDDSARKLAIAVLEPGMEEPTLFTIDASREQVRRFSRRLIQRTKGVVQACYEAGPLGFELQRWLQEDGVDCKVAAPAQTPRRPGQRVKTDGRDARKLVRLFRAGELTWIRSPTIDDEIARDLVRYAATSRSDLLRAYNRLGKLLLRHGHHWRREARTKAHREWLRSLKFEQARLQQLFELEMHSIEQLEAHFAMAERSVAELAATDPYREKVGWLSCLRGINIHIAMVILTELHGFQRFTKPRHLMAFLGIVSSEYSTGDRQRQGAITKTGNSHVRWALVQMAHSLRHRPGASKVILARRLGQPPLIVSIAEKAEARGYSRFIRLRERGKEYNKIMVALAREQVGFIWSILTSQTNATTNAH
jgi:transposase